MSLNLCTINRQAINAACGLYSVLAVTPLTFTVTVVQGQVLPLTLAASFTGGPVTGLTLTAGALNGPGGTLAVTATPAALTGGIFLGGTATTQLGTYTATVRVHGTISDVDLTITVVVVSSAQLAGSQQHVSRNQVVPLHLFRRREEPDAEPLKLEQPIVGVQVELLGQRFSQALAVADAGAFVLVTASNLTVTQPAEPTAPVAVNISDLTLSQALAATDVNALGLVSVSDLTVVQPAEPMTATDVNALGLVSVSDLTMAPPAEPIEPAAVNISDLTLSEPDA
jgi:hypothetical protein